MSEDKTKLEQAPTPIHAMYLRWMDCRNRYNDNDGEPDSLFDELIDLERKILAIRPTTFEDYAFKILVADNDGDMNTNTFQVGMVEEAKAVVAGVPTGQSEALKLDA